MGDTDKYISKSSSIKTKLNCNYTSPIDLAPNGIKFANQSEKYNNNC